MTHSDSTLRVFGFPDVHWSDRDEAALGCAERAHRLFKPDITVIGGDLISAPPFSNFPSSTFNEAAAQDWESTELAPAAKFVERLGKQTRDRLYLIEGNHEAHVERWATRLGRIGQSIYPMLSPRRRLLEGLDKRKHLWVPWAKYPTETNFLRLRENLVVVHGWSACKHAAAKHLADSRSRSIIFHHTHRRQHVVERDPWDDRPIEAMSAGCLCKLHPIYKTTGVTQWSHGFWIAYMSRTARRDYTLYGVTISKGRAIMPDGKEIKV